MKLLGYRSYDWVADSYWAALPNNWVPIVSVDPNVIPRPGTYATLGIGVVGAMTIPARFGYTGALTYEQAWLNLFKRLNPIDTSPGQLRGVRNDGTPVAIPAVMQIQAIAGGNDDEDDVNIVFVNFVAVQPYWEPINVPGVTTQVFESDGLRQSVLFDVQGEWPTNPTIRVMATAQRATPTATVGWKYRRRVTVSNAGSDPIQNYPFAIDLGLTNGLVSGGKALSSGNDLRVVYQGKEIARNLTDWNSASFTSLVWVTIPYLAGGGASITYDVLYGNANAGTPPTLTPGLDKPAFDIATAGANRSSNAKWVYLVDRTVANAGLGGWYLDSGTAQPNVKFNVPGAWQLATTLVGNDDRSQQAYSTYVATGTKYQGRFEARRAKAGSVVITEHNGADGVGLRNPVGISSVRCDLRFLNMAQGDTDTTPIGEVIILTRNNPGENFGAIYSNAALTDPEATIATATYTPASAVKEVYFAVWPNPGANDKKLSIDPKARNDRYVNASWYTTLEVNIAPGVLVQSWTPANMGTALKAWFAADQISGVADGAALATWQDLSANNLNATQGTGASQPIYRANLLNGLPGVDFVSTDTLVTNLSASSLDESILVVIDLDTDGTRGIVGASATGGRGFYTVTGRHPFSEKVGVGAIYSAAGSIALDTPAILSSKLGTTTWESTINGGTPETGTHAQTLTGSLTTTIGAALANNRQLVEGYLAWKWGLVGNLPGGHPYKTLAPNLSVSGVENEVYEFVTSLRYQGGGDAVGVPPYKTVRLGNVKGASGAGTPRLFAPLNKQVQVFTDTAQSRAMEQRRHRQRGRYPIAAVSAIDGVLGRRREHGGAAERGLDAAVAGRQSAHEPGL
jgi:hypothetical protein